MEGTIETIASTSNDWAVAYLNIHLINMQTIRHHSFDQFWLNQLNKVQFCVL